MTSWCTTKLILLLEVLVLPAAEATAQATLLAGRSCGQSAKHPERPERKRRSALTVWR